MSPAHVLRRRPARLLPPVGSREAGAALPSTGLGHGRSAARSGRAGGITREVGAGYRLPFTLPPAGEAALEVCTHRPMAYAARGASAGGCGRIARSSGSSIRGLSVGGRSRGSGRPGACCRAALPIRDVVQQRHLIPGHDTAALLDASSAGRAASFRERHTVQCGAVLDCLRLPYRLTRERCQHLMPGSG